MVKRFDGKVVIVTGSSNGIGRATAVMFASEGAKIVITGRNEQSLNEAKSEAIAAGAIEANVHIVKGDLTNEETQKNLIDSTIKKFGKINVLVNNAGGTAPDNTASQGFDQSLEVYDYVMNLNTRSVLSLCKLALPALIESQGDIVMISSIAGLNNGAPNFPYYSMSKAALDQLTRAMAIKYIRQGVRVNAINPGMVSTKIMQKQGVPDEIVTKIENVMSADRVLVPAGRPGQPNEIAEAILFLSDRRTSGYIVGHNLVIDGGASIQIPSLVCNIMDYF